MAAVMPAAQAAKPFVAKEPVRAAADQSQAGARIIVKYKKGSAVSVDRNAKLGAVNSAVGRAGLGAQSARGQSAATRANYVRKLGVGADLFKLSRRVPEAQLQQLVRELRADPSVEYAQVDRMRRLDDAPIGKVRAAATAEAFTPNDQYYAQYQWHFHNAVGGVNAPAAWDISKGDGAVVAVLDTGVVLNHPDLQANLLEGYDFITDAFVSRRATDDRVPGAKDYGDWTLDGDCSADWTAEASSWHGTHTSGTVAEVTNNSVGMAGLAHNAKVLPVRVLGRCGGYDSDIADAIIWASGGTVDGVPANQNPAEVVSLSLSGPGACDQATQDAITGANSRGTLVVVSAGNQAADASTRSPANCNGVVTVGATRVTGGIAYYSNFGAVVDLSAPGGGGSVDGNPNGYVWSTGSDSDTTPEAGAPTYFGLGGTSMSTPHVAATAALVQSALAGAGRDPLTPAAMEALLKETARPFPVAIPSGTPIGAGIVDAKAALDKALEVPCDPETEQCGPEATPLTNKVAVSGLSGAAGSEALYSFEASAGSTLSILTYGGTGNVSVYVSFGAEPTTTASDAKSTRVGNSETVRFQAAQAGTYYIKLVGAAAYSGVTLVARQ
ncbi:S8 family peptidase [Luteimonas aquatica]|uniref:S8 family peptidase n=1 Tax=Luteimonas aquatica TaxID=450364 RepID=UPI001F5A2937|nr:S8 family peptidase [Luteimonas aquatica]